MTKPINGKKIIWWVIVLITVLAFWNYLLSFLYTADDQIWTWPEFFVSIGYYFVFGIGALLGLTSSFYFGSRNTVSRGLFFLGLASLSILMGFIIWDFQTFILKVAETPFPSIADILFLLQIPLAIIGLSMLLKVYSIPIGKRQWLEGIIVFLLTASAITYLSGGFPELDSLDLFTKAITFSYAFSDSILITIAYMILRLSGGRIFKGIIIYTLGLFTLVIADLLFAYRIENDIFYDGDISDIMYIITGTIFTIGIYYTIQSLSTQKAKN